MKEEDNSENKAKACLEGGSSLSAFDLMVPKANSLEFVVDAANNGYTQQSGKIYTEQGKLCALTRQCMVYFDTPQSPTTP